MAYLTVLIMTILFGFAGMVAEAGMCGIAAVTLAIFHILER